MRAIIEFLKRLFGCTHNLSWPRSDARSSTGMYRVCLRCGRELEVDTSTWQPTGACMQVHKHKPFDGASRGWRWEEGL